MQNPFDTEERRSFREALRRLIDTEIRPNADAWDEEGDFPWEIHEKLGELGCFGIGMNEEYGGLGFDDCFMRIIMLEELGRCGAGGVPAGVGGRLISTGPIQILASEEIKKRVLPEVIAGREGSSLAITEPSGGSDVANMRTTAVRDGDSYVLNGSKTFISGGMKSRYFVVAARTGGKGLHGISLFLVEHGTPGFTRTPLKRKMGWWCSDQATLYFDNCRVPAAHLLGEENKGFLAIMQNFNLERVGMMAQCLGMMKLCLEDSVAWAKERQTFGKPLIQHQTIRHKIAEMSARIDAVEALLIQIAWNVNEGRMPVAEISKGKFFTTGALQYVVSEAMQIMGGAGYLRGNAIERAYRETKVMAIAGGSEEIMRDLAVNQMSL